MKPLCTMRKPRVIDLMSLISAHQLTQTPAWAVCVHNKWRTHITARCRWVTSGGGAAWQSFKTCLNGFVCYRGWSQRPEGRDECFLILRSWSFISFFLLPWLSSLCLTHNLTPSAAALARWCDEMTALYWLSACSLLCHNCIITTWWSHS